MEVLLKCGRYAGEVKDLAPDAARAMIDDGHAEDARFVAAPKIQSALFPGVGGKQRQARSQPKGNAQ